MNSSTTTFNYKKCVQQLFALTIIFYLMANFIGFGWNEHQRARNEKNFTYLYFDTRGNKAVAKELFGNTRPDIVFVGNSITKYHTDTNLFYQAGIKIFNYSTIGYFIAQYPDMVKNAIKLKPKMIVFSMQKHDFYGPNDFYYQHFDHGNDISFYNLKFLATHINFHDHEAVKLFGKYLGAYLKRGHYFIARGYISAKEVAEIYDRLLRGSKIKTIMRDIFNGGVRKSLISFNCRFGPDGNSIPEHCYNGDAVAVDTKLVTTIPENYHTYVDAKQEMYNSIIVDVLNGFFDQIRAAGIQPVLVLEPSFDRLKLNEQPLFSALHVKIIDMSMAPFSVNYYQDSDHYNLQGRQQYSTLLLTNLKPLLALA